ncbi:DUF1656 domain-containing protein [Maridesulfovibrio bastinii]|uniref:DUF1656 domain-containing protein n=1 Tax=Maridesulfovibrio bastinii TaxID=47157 RepID=UPI000427C35E|nr:DUF1656 domain-containing protein [Maridesulfovibrio bastinii]
MQEINIYGMFIPVIAVIMLISLVQNWVACKILVRIGFYRLVWHKALFNLALFVTLLCLNVIIYNRYLI